MKTMQKIFLISATGVLGFLLFIWANPYKVGSDSAPPEAMNTEFQTQSAPPATRNVGQSESLGWKKLISLNNSSNNYPAFVANLRAAGCPESSLQDIVSNDVEREFSAKRSKLHLSETEPGPWSEQAQRQLVQLLLGHASPSAVSKKLASVHAAAASEYSASAKPVLPLVLQNVDLSTLGLNNDQRQQIDSIRQDFIKQIGGLDQNPADPAYLERWQQAQPEADNNTLIFLGWNAYYDYQISAYQKSLAQTYLQNQNTSLQ